MMATQQAVHNRVHSQATVSANGSSPVFNTAGHKRFQLNVVIANAPTGTSPTLTFKVMVSSDNISFAQKGGALASLNAAGVQRTLYANGSTQGQVVEPFARVDWTISGAGANFTGLSTTFHSVDC